MSGVEFENNKVNTEEGIDKSSLLERIEDAYKVYKLCGVDLNDIADDYGKQKIARLRLDFARHELLVLLKQAKEKGIEYDKSKIIKHFHLYD